MKYEAVIGLEVHAELSTKSKIYCSCSTGFRRTDQHSHLPGLTGMPAHWRYINKQVVHYAAKNGQGYRLHHQSSCARLTVRTIFTRSAEGVSDFPV